MRIYDSFSAASANNTIASFGLAHGEHNTLYYYYYIGVCVCIVYYCIGSVPTHTGGTATRGCRRDPPPQIHIRAQYFSIYLKSPQKNHVYNIILSLLLY